MSILYCSVCSYCINLVVVSFYYFFFILLLIRCNITWKRKHFYNMSQLIWGLLYSFYCLPTKWSSLHYNIIFSLKVSANNHNYLIHVTVIMGVICHNSLAVFSVYFDRGSVKRRITVIITVVIFLYYYIALTPKVITVNRLIGVVISSTFSSTLH